VQNLPFITSADFVGLIVNSVMQVLYNYSSYDWLMFSAQHNSQLQERSFTRFWWIYVLFAEIVENQTCFTLGVRANVQPQNLAFLLLQKLKSAPKSFALGVKAEIEIKISICLKY